MYIVKNNPNLIMLSYKCFILISERKKLLNLMDFECDHEVFPKNISYQDIKTYL